ncbi:unnamed protein product, partial [Mesorhabditis belari]|uniref:Sulfhydryl oxidase n=1 Tax=Mesorhabditis belari TaxID=2138241 RepID=A0AAF3J9X4_9BILA
MWWIAVVAAWLSVPRVAVAIISTYNYVPQGLNPTLYTPGFEPVVHLDQATFADTVYYQDRAFVVEFYADWCGHCRAFAPYFREFANQVYPWNKIVTVAVINCADAYNQNICRENGIDHYPVLKYFARTARSAGNGIALETPHAPDALRDGVLRAVLNEYAFNRYPDWPPFTHIQVNDRTTYGQLWDGVPQAAEYMAIVFETTDGLGARFMLDMFDRRGLVGTKRALYSSPLVNMLMIKEFPSVALFRRDHQQAIYMSRLTNASFSEIDRAIEGDRWSHNRAPPATFPPSTTTTLRPFTTTRAPVIDCFKFPDSCRDMYYVSETDMLKAMHTALYDEVIRSPGFIQGENFTNLFNFVDLLANHFPVLSFSNELKRTLRKKRTSSTILKNSERARLVFTHLREWLDSRRSFGHISVDEWRRQFDTVERVYAHPFPTNSSWQHCKGTSAMFRGYTCGLWTTFHALSVHTYIDTIKDERVDPLRPLKSIQGWVSSFFGCRECRDHFMAMTTTKFPMTERRVRHPHDMMTYLWRAHNIVNDRLKGTTTEDPQFSKMQFPAPFLCPTCHSGGQFSRRQVRNFLLRYYGSIKPHNRLADRRLAF